MVSVLAGCISCATGSVADAKRFDPGQEEACFIAFRKLGISQVDANGASTKLDVSSYRTGMRQKIAVIADETMGSNARAAIADGIRSTNDFLAGKFVIPKKLYVDSPHEAAEASALKGRNCEISFPSRFICPHGLVLSEVDSAPIGEHEYGHILYYTQMKHFAQTGVISKRYNAVAKFVEERKEALHLQIQKSILDRQISDGRTTADEADLLKQKREAVQRKLFEFGKRDDELRAGLKGLPEDFHTPYEELFSDLLSISKRNDPKAISKSVGGMDSQMRDASVPRTSILWMHDTMSKDEDVHHVFAPTLSHIWLTHLKIAKGPVERAEILRLVFLGIAKETDERAGDPRLWNISVETRNDRLRTMIDSILIRAN